MGVDALEKRHTVMKLDTFDKIVTEAQRRGPKRVALASAADPVGLAALREGMRENLVEAVLVGEREAITSAAAAAGVSLEGFDIDAVDTAANAAPRAVALVREGRADILMKGSLATGNFMREVLDPDRGLRAGTLVSHVAVLESRKLGKLFLMTDGGIVLAPTLEEKAAIIRNALPLARTLGITNPNVAVVAAVEKVNKKMPETLDAEQLVAMNREGRITGCVVGGPFGMDNAISEEAARVKNIRNPVAGNADIILFPSVAVGNIACKAVMYMADCRFGGLVVGAAAPVVLLSRADTMETKLHSLALGVLAAGGRGGDAAGS